MSVFSSVRVYAVVGVKIKTITMEANNEVTEKPAVVDLKPIGTNKLLEELEDRLFSISESDVEFLKDHFDWVDEDKEDQALIEQAAEILDWFKVESILDTSKLEYLAKVFGKYTLEQMETLLPE